MLDHQPDAVVHEVPLRLVSAGDTLLLTATLRYDASDPYAVEATFRAGAGAEAISWVLGRDLLRDGLDGDSGEGDVHVWPTTETGAGLSSHVDDEVAMIELCSPDGRALLAAPAPDVRRFLARSYDAVPSGEEHLHLDVDATIERLLA